MRFNVLYFLGAALTVANASAVTVPQKRDIEYGTPIPIFGDRFSNSNLIDGSLELPLDEGSITVSCVDCYAQAGILVNVTLEEDQNITDSLVTVGFYNTEAYVELSLVAQGHGRAFIPLWSSSPSSGDDPILDVAVEFGIALEMTADIDLRTGFRLSIPQGSFASFIPTVGFQETNLGLSTFEQIPLRVESGSATFKAALQARVVMSINVDTDVVDARGELGAYVNLPELVVNLHSSDTCDLETTSFFDISVGLWASSDVSVGWKDTDVDQAGEEHRIDATLWTYDETATDCWADTPTSFLVGGPPPLTPTAPDDTPTIVVSGAPPPTSTAPIETQSIIVSGAPPLTASETTTHSFKDQTSFGNTTVTASPDVYTTSTVYATKVYTTVTCPSYVVQCPAGSQETAVVTDIVELYTTVCPVTNAQTVPADVTSVRTKTTFSQSTLSIFEQHTSTLSSHEVHQTVIPSKDAPEASSTRELGSIHSGDDKPKVTGDANLLVPTSTSPQEISTLSVVPVTAGALCMEVSKLSLFLVFGAWFLSL